MTDPHFMHWKSLSADGRVLWLKYTFGQGTANSLAAKLRDGSWMVVSPPCDAPSDVHDRLERDGPVRALVAPNHFHNMGQAEWRRRHPDARSYAAPPSFARLTSKTPSVDYRPISELEQLLSPDLLLVPDGMKTPDVLFRFSAPSGNIWWLGDQVSNNRPADQKLPLRILSGLLGSGPGYRANPKPELVYVADRAAWLRPLREALAEAPPSIVLPAHGDPVSVDAAHRTREIFGGLESRRTEAEGSGKAAYALVGAVLGLSNAMRRLFDRGAT